MKIFGCVSFYDDAPLLRNSIDAMKQSGLTVIAVDGGYKEFLKCDKTGKQKLWSTDGSIDVAKSHADFYIPAPKWGYVDQAQKRSMYFQVIEEGSYAIIIDSDEILEPCNLSKECFKEDVYNIFIKNSESIGITTRVYKVSPDLKYLYRHCMLYNMRDHDFKGPNKTGLVTSNRGNVPRPTLYDKSTKAVTINHMRHERPVERQEQGDEYKRIRRELKVKNPMEY